MYARIANRFRNMSTDALALWCVLAAIAVSLSVLGVAAKTDRIPFGSEPSSVVEIDEDVTFNTLNDILLYDDPARDRGLPPAEMLVASEPKAPLTAFEQFLVRTDQETDVKPDPTPSPEDTYTPVPEAPKTVTVGGLELELPPGYSRVPEDNLTPEGAVEFDGPEDDVGEYRGDGFYPILRLGTVGFGVSNWINTSECELVGGQSETMNLIVDRETLVGLKQYNCDGVSFMHAYAEVYDTHVSGLQFWAEYFAQTDRVPDEFVPMLGTATLVTP